MGAEGLRVEPPGRTEPVAPTAATGENLRAEVVAAIAAIAPETDVRKLAPDRPLRDQVELDSMDWINVVEELCRRLSVDIPESDYGRLTTIDAIAAYLQSRARPADARPGVTVIGDELPFVCHLVDGRHVTIRPIAAADAPLESGFVDRLSMQSRYERFMVTMRELPASKLRYLTDVDQRRHVALVATVEPDGEESMVGAARYAVLDDGARCEFAVAVDDRWRRRGLAGVLMQALIAVARHRGLKVMEGSVLATNSAMLAFARRLGFRQERSAEDPQTVRIVRAL